MRDREENLPTWIVQKKNERFFAGWCNICRRWNIHGWSNGSRQGRCAHCRCCDHYYLDLIANASPAIMADLKRKRPHGPGDADFARNPADIERMQETLRQEKALRAARMQVARHA